MIAIPACAVCVAPVAGRPRVVVEPGADVERGQVVAVVEADQGEVPVRAPVRGRLGGSLAASTVGQGEGLVWLSR